jgi:hypothetical protein
VELVCFTGGAGLRSRTHHGGGKKDVDFVKIVKYVKLESGMNSTCIEVAGNPYSMDN